MKYINIKNKKSVTLLSEHYEINKWKIYLSIFVILIILYKLQL